MKKPKKQLTEEFLEKIKSLGFNTGAKPDDACHNCGKPLHEHHLVGIAVGGVLNIPKRRKQGNKLNTGNEEAAFAA